MANSNHKLYKSIQYDKISKQIKRPTLLLRSRTGEFIANINYVNLKYSFVGNGLDELSFEIYKDNAVYDTTTYSWDTGNYGTPDLQGYGNPQDVYPASVEYVNSSYLELESGMLYQCDSKRSGGRNVYFWDMDNGYQCGRISNTEHHSYWEKLTELAIVEYVNYGLFEASFSVQDSDAIIKTCTAVSLETELGQRFLRNFHVNDEEAISADDYSVTTLYNPTDKEHSLLHRSIKDRAPHWSIGEVSEYINTGKYVENSKGIIREFTIDGTSIYDFLTNDIANEIKCLFIFDTYNRKINCYNLEPCIFDQNSMVILDGAYYNQSNGYYYDKNDVLIPVIYWDKTKREIVGKDYHIYQKSTGIVIDEAYYRYVATKGSDGIYVNAEGIAPSYYDENGNIKYYTTDPSNSAFWKFFTYYDKNGKNIQDAFIIFPSYCDGYGSDTNVFISKNKLANSFNLDTNKDSIKNCFYVTGSDDVINNYVGIANGTGDNYIYVFDNFQYEDMGETLDDLIHKYIQYYNENIEKFNGDGGLFLQYCNALNDYYNYKDNMFPDTSISKLPDNGAEVEFGKLVEHFESTDNSVIIITSFNNESYANVTKTVEQMLNVQMDSRYTLTIDNSTTNCSGYTEISPTPDYYSSVWSGKITLERTTKTSDSYEGIITIQLKYYPLDYSKQADYIKQRINVAIAKSSIADIQFEQYISVEQALQIYTDNGWITTSDPIGTTAFIKWFTDSKTTNSQKDNFINSNDCLVQFMNFLDQYNLTSLKSYADAFQSCVDLLDQLCSSQTSDTYKELRRRYALFSQISRYKYNLRSDEVNKKYVACQEKLEEIYEFEKNMNMEKYFENNYYNNSSDDDYKKYSDNKTSTYFNNNAFGFEKWIWNKPRVIRLFGYGNPESYGYKAKYYTYMCYLDNNNGYVYSSSGDSWSKYGEATRKTYDSLPNDEKLNWKKKAYSYDIGNKLWLQFQSYIREDEYNNSNYSSEGLEDNEILEMSQELLSVARIELRKACVRQYSISGDINNIFTIEELEKLYSSFNLFNYVRSRVDDKLYKLRLVQVDFDENSLEKLNVTFSEQIENIDNTASDINSILSQASSIATSYPSTVRQAESGAGAMGEFYRIKSDGLSAADVMLKASDDEEVIIDNNGILCRSLEDFGGYGEHQVRITGNLICFTDDSWASPPKLALGYTLIEGEWKYGLIADAVVANTLSTITTTAGLIRAGRIVSNDYTGFDEPNNNPYSYSSNNWSNDKDGKGSTVDINLDTGTFRFGKEDSVNLSWDGNKTFKIGDSDNYLLWNGEEFTITGNLSAKDGAFSGTINATSGTIGSGDHIWTIGSDEHRSFIYSGCNSTTSTTSGTYIGTDGIRQISSDGTKYSMIKDGTITTSYITADAVKLGISLSISSEGHTLELKNDGSIICDSFRSLGSINASGGLSVIGDSSSLSVGSGKVNLFGSGQSVSLDTNGFRYNSNDVIYENSTKYNTSYIDVANGSAGNIIFKGALDADGKIVDAKKIAISRENIPFRSIHIGSAGKYIIFVDVDDNEYKVAIDKTEES